MKHTIAILLLGLTFASCKKCYQCTTSVSTTPSSIGGIPTGGSASTTLEVCKMSKKDKEAYEKAGTTSTTSSAGGITITQTSTTKCR